VLSFLVYTSVFICLLVYVLAVALPYAVVLLLPRRLSEHCMRALALHMGRLVIYGALRPFVRVRYKDASGGQRPGFYVFNHRAATDAFLVAALGREAIQLVNGWPMRLPFFGFNARRCGYLDTTATPLEAYPALIGDLLRQGVSVIVFPEGTRSESRRMNAFHSGIFKLAMELKLPLYPCCIAGNEAFPDRSFKFHKTSRILVHRLPPVLPEDYANMPTAYVLKKHLHTLIAQETEKMDRELHP
jgi:1-acyl-sn-glycerol-3-phosphate acyltransferase